MRMTSSADPNELGEFLKARRAELSPRTVGLPDCGRPRRVAGLRREEVALLATISTDYYTRLEQGRVQPSAAVLAAVARVLHLDDDQRDRVFALAGSPGGRARRRTAQQVQPQLRRLLDNLTTVPGMVVGRSTDILAWNPLAAALLTDFAKVPEKKRNYARLLFTDPAMKSLYADWELTARTVVAHLRRRAAEYPDDPQLALLIGELSMKSPEFRRWLAAHPVGAHIAGTKALNHPVVGRLTLDWNLLTCSTDARQALVVWTAEPGTPSYENLRILSSWNASATGCAAL